MEHTLVCWCKKYPLFHGFLLWFYTHFHRKTWRIYLWITSPFLKEAWRKNIVRGGPKSMEIHLQKHPLFAGIHGPCLQPKTPPSFMQMRTSVRSTFGLDCRGRPRVQQFQNAPLTKPYEKHRGGKNIAWGPWAARVYTETSTPMWWDLFSPVQTYTLVNGIYSFRYFLHPFVIRRIWHMHYQIWYTHLIEEVPERSSIRLLQVYLTHSAFYG